jgi:hypothetical protein
MGKFTRLAIDDAGRTTPGTGGGWSQRHSMMPGVVD